MSLNTYKVIDDFLPDDDFKSFRDLIVRYETSNGQTWPEYLTSVGDVGIEKPIITELKKESFNNKNDLEIFENFTNLLSNNLTEYSNYKVISWKQNIYRYKYKSGILLHRDSDGSNNLGSTRLGISFYLNGEWKQNWGGELFIYQGGENKWGYVTENNDDLFRSLKLDDVITPRPNRLVIVDGPWHKLNPNQSKNNDRLSLQTFITIRPKHKTKPKIFKGKK